MQSAANILVKLAVKLVVVKLVVASSKGSRQLREAHRKS